MTTGDAARPGRGEHAEGVVQVVILLTIGTTAAAASFTHVHNVAAAHGQPGWLAWADAVVLELMSIATGLEIRRRHRTGQPVGFVVWVLVGAVALSLSAQVVEAERSVIGWLAAALPAAGFLALVKIVLSRRPAGTPVPAEDEDGTGAVPDPDDEDAADRLHQARQIAAAHLAEHGRPITRDQLRSHLRTGTATATALHRQLREDGRTGGLVPVPPDAFTRINGGGR
jgi:hypothetical protein